MGVKEVERAELHKTIWRIANDLRGSVDGWDFKTYVLGMLFYRFISENLTAYLNEQERRAGNPDFDYATLSDADAERGRAGDGRGEGLLHPAERALRQRPRAGAARREPQRDARAGLPPHRGLGGRRGQRGRPQGTVRRPRRQQHQARPDRGQAQREARQAARRDRRPATSALRRQHHRRVRRRLRVPDGDVRLERRQVRRRVLHAAGGLRAAGADHRRRQDRGQQGLRPGLRLRVAAAEVREGARHGQRAPGLLRPGDQPDDLQPVPDQHVPARHQLREVRHRPRRHADRPGALGRRAVRGDRLQPAVLDQVGGRREPAADQRPALRPGRRARARSRGPTSPSRCTC